MADDQTSPSYFDRMLEEERKNPEFAVEFDRHYHSIQAIDQIVNALDDLRIDLGKSKAELAREIGKNPANIRRLLTTSGNPELRTIVALADALDADVRIVPRKRNEAA